MRVNSRGQDTIPVDMREKAGLLPQTEVTLGFDGDSVRIVKGKDGAKPTRGQRLIEHMRLHRADVQMTTDEIMALTRGE